MRKKVLDNSLKVMAFTHTNIDRVALLLQKFAIQIFQKLFYFLVKTMNLSFTKLKTFKENLPKNCFASFESTFEFPKKSICTRTLACI